MSVPVNSTTLKYNVRGQLKQVHIVTEWRDGCVYRTKSLGLVVASTYQPCVQASAAMVGPISTADTRRLMGVRA